MTHPDTIKLRKLTDLLLPLVEAREKATDGQWSTTRAIIDIDYYDQIWTDTNKHFPLFAYDYANYTDNDAEFVSLAANTVAKIKDVLGEK